MTTNETLNESPGAGAGALARPEAQLVVALECDRPRAGSARHSLRGIDEVTLGRAEQRTAARNGSRLALTLPSRWMSSVHARVRREDDRWVLEDLGSRNGTLVNGKTVVHLVLRDGDLIEVGRTLILFREAIHAPPDAPLDFEADGTSIRAPGLGTMIPALAGELDALAKIAESNVPLLLLGESGTGKEVLARSAHTLSKRSGAFVPVNCGAIPEALMESQLFGHTKGAFSGAVRDEPGFVRAADGGTLFLDEIGDLPKPSQAALLRVLQEGEVVPVGGTRALMVNVRAVAATHRPLESLVARGDFRADLLARLDGFRYSLPPLRERLEDFGLLVADLLPRVAPGRELTLSTEVGRAFFRYAWPLNIRELQQCLARAAALVGPSGVIERAHLPPVIAQAHDAHVVAAEEPVALAADEDARLRAQLESLLAQHDGNVAEVARAVGKARMQIHRWMKRFALDPKRFRR